MQKQCIGLKNLESELKIHRKVKPLCLCFATGNCIIHAICRTSCNPSQQVEEEIIRLFAKYLESSYLCTSFLIHTCLI